MAWCAGQESTKVLFASFHTHPSLKWGQLWPWALIHPRLCAFKLLVMMTLQQWPHHIASLGIYILLLSHSYLWKMLLRLKMCKNIGLSIWNSTSHDAWLHWCPVLTMCCGFNLLSTVTEYWIIPDEGLFPPFHPVLNLWPNTPACLLPDEQCLLYTLVHSIRWLYNLTNTILVISKPHCVL